MEQPTKKISIIHGNVILAGTGSVGLNQRFRAILNQLFVSPDFLAYDQMTKAKLITANAIQDFQNTGIQPGKINYGALVAFPGTNVELGRAEK